MKPQAFVCARSSGQLYRTDVGALDHGSTAVDFRVQTAHFALDGEGGESAFFNLYLTVTASAACTLRVTPLVDGVEQRARTVMLAVQPHPVPQTLEVPLYDDTGWGTFALRGGRFAARVESVGGLGVGELRVDGMEVEVETVREGRQPQ